jgi:putative flippase GtrA
MRLASTTSTLRQSVRTATERAWANGEHKLLTRYILVSGVIGAPLSILTLQVMIFLYHSFIGDFDRLTLNLMWIINFEIGLLRNFVLHCAFTWKTNPTRTRLAHVHVAAIGAFVIDIAAFNIVLFFTDIILIAQVFGGSSGFFCNFLYNRIRTFGAPPATRIERADALETLNDATEAPPDHGTAQRQKDEAMTEGGIV